MPGSIPENPMTALDLISQAVRLGVGVVQIADNLPVDRLTQTELRALKTRCGCTQRVTGSRYARYRSGAFAALPGTGLPFGLADPAPGGRYRQIHHPTPDEVIAALHSLEDDFKAAGIRLAIENHDRFPCATLVKDHPQPGKRLGRHLPGYSQLIRRIGRAGRCDKATGSAGNQSPSQGFYNF